MSDIEFGEIEQASPQQQLRPDRNRHFAVTPVFAPRDEELPIFVDMDVMRDMEAHAQSDTGVELGGVLLGGQFTDEQGLPFVVVTDSLRAKHYESTKGSFKFTHDTWEQITRERDSFPPDLQMVGWYHTHPGWGVFLSGMDMFICDHFFNRPLDVALVIDPCQDDRGFFQWTKSQGNPVQRTGGFYLTASRFRATELAAYANTLEGKAMAPAPQFSNPPIYPFPVLPAGPTPPWQLIAVLGMFSLQFCLLLLLAWRLLLPVNPSLPAAETRAAEERADRLAEARRREAFIDAKLEVLEQVVRQGTQAPEGILKNLAERTAEVTELRDNVRAQQSLQRELDAKAAQLESSLVEARRRDTGQQAEVARLESKIGDLTKQLDASQEKLASYEKKSGTEADEQEPASWWSAAVVNSRPIGFGALLGLIATGAAFVAIQRWKGIEGVAERDRQTQV